MTQPNRPKVPLNIETNILVKSGRRCALCFGLLGDSSIKLGQIAHVDKNPENNKENNLAFLCLVHHSQYDSKTSQSKGYTQSELKSYREKLYQAIEKGFLPQNQNDLTVKQPNEIIEHDKIIFQNAEKLLSESELKAFLEQLLNDHSCTTLEFRCINRFITHFDTMTNFFIYENLNSLREELITLLNTLTNFIALKFFIYPKGQTGENKRLCLQPNLNIDREGCPGDEDIFVKYEKLVNELDDYCYKILEKYKEYRLQIKKQLII